MSIQDKLLIKAYNAHQKDQIKVLRSVVNQMPEDELADYPRYWYLTAAMNQTVNADLVHQVQQFKSDFPQSPLNNNLRSALLYALFNSHEDTLFLNTLEAPDLNNVNVLCAKLSLTLSPTSPDKTIKQAKNLWLDNPDNHFCTLLVTPLTALSALSHEELWQALSHALHNHQDNRAQLINQSLPHALQWRDKEWRNVNNDPQRFLNKTLAEQHLDDTHIILILYALQLVAKDDALEASRWWQNHAGQFSPYYRDWGWAEIAYQGALKLNPQALEWFHRAKEGINEEHYRAWHVRIALRNERWLEALETINSMPMKEQKLRLWQYWKAQAFNHLNQAENAKPILESLSKEADFYGLLSRDELALLPPTQPEPAAVTESEISQLTPKLQRAIRLHRLNIKPMDRIEWNTANQSLTAREHLVAAHVAQQIAWFDRSIFSASQAGSQQDLTLSYPTPFQPKLEETVKKRHLDEAWVYGLIRQESQFAPQALSRTGAQGLMQIMPLTARWIAKHLSLKRFLPDQTTELETNLNLGTYYLQHLLEQLNTPALATAGYNAGPRRVKQWLGTKPMDGIVFVETIPFNETRDYVKRVMANTVLYSQRLNKPYIPLKERIGTIPTIDNLQPTHLGEP
ncbi:MAG: lytic transglycosylase domain-containing protein [Betaproteobacteria bacterium]|nr:lytic transglycosylase domain-containing protein [Betaproteobacteria bacterium]